MADKFNITSLKVEEKKLIYKTEGTEKEVNFDSKEFVITAIAGKTVSEAPEPSSIDPNKSLKFTIGTDEYTYIPSKLLAYGNVEIFGVDIKASYDSLEKRVLAMGKIDTDNLDNKDIQSILQDLNIVGLEGYLGCNLDFEKDSKFIFVAIQQTQDKEKLKTIYEEYEKINTGNAGNAGNAENAENERNVKIKLAKKIINIANNIKGAKGYKEENYKIQEKTLEVICEEAEKYLEDKKDQDSIFQKLDIKFKNASLLYYKGDDLTSSFGELFNDTKKKLNDVSGILDLKEEAQNLIVVDKTEVSAESNQ